MSPLSPRDLYLVDHPGTISGREHPLTPDQLRSLRSRPDMTRRVAGLLDAGERLITYAEALWPWLDPGQPFIRGWAIEAIAEHLEAVTRGQIKKLLINVPPGFSKACQDSGIVQEKIKGLVPLDSIVVGDHVLTHRGRFRRVSGVHPQGLMPIVSITTLHGRISNTEPEHPYLTPLGWVQAQHLTTDDVLMHVAPDRAGQPDPIAKIERLPPAPVRCLTVEDDHSFVYQGLAVHNSLLTCVYWPSWEWGPMGRPMERYVCTSYDIDLVIRDNVKCRQLMLTNDYQAAWGDVFAMSSDQNTKIRFGNDKTGWKAGLSMEGLTGDRGTRFIFDDPQSVKGAASDATSTSTLTSFAHAMPTRTQSAENPFIGIMQRLRQNDISGVILEMLGKSWEHLWIPMHFADGEKNRSRTALGWVDPRSIPGSRARGYYVVARDAEGREVREWRDAFHVGKAKEGYLADPVRFPPEHIDDLEATMSLTGGISAIKGQLENDPLQEGGEFFVGEWQPWALPYPDGMTWVRGWDFASATGQKNDWTVGWLWGRFPGWSPHRGIVVRSIVRFRALPGVVRARFIATSKADGPRVHIAVPKDPGPGGAWVVADLTNALPGHDVWSERQDQHKTVRARPMSGWFGEGLIYYDVSLDKIQAEGMPEGTTIMSMVRAEWQGFDRASHDDLVDAPAIGMARLGELNFEDGVGEAPEDHADQSSFLANESVYGDLDLGPAGSAYLD